MQDEYGNGVSYVGDEGTVSVYEVTMRNRQVLLLRIDRDDPELRIGYARPDWVERGEAVRFMDVDDSGCGGHSCSHAERRVTDEVTGAWRVSADSVKSFARGHLSFMLVDVYVPEKIDS